MNSLTRPQHYVAFVDFFSVLVTQARELAYGVGIDMALMMELSAIDIALNVDDGFAVVVDNKIAVNPLAFRKFVAPVGSQEFIVEVFTPELYLTHRFTFLNR